MTNTNTNNTAGAFLAGFINLFLDSHYVAIKKARRAAGKERARALAQRRAKTGEPRLWALADLQREGAFCDAPSRATADHEVPTSVAHALAAEGWGGSLAKAALRARLRGVKDPDQLSVGWWLAEGVPAKAILWRWKLVASAKTPGQAAAGVAHLSRAAALARADRVVESLALEADMAYEEWDDGMYYRYPVIDRDASRAVEATSADAGTAEIRRALAAVKADRRRQAIEEGVEVLAPFLAAYPAPAEVVLPFGWRWADVDDAAALARWVANSGACLLTVVDPQLDDADGYGIRWLALGPERQVVGLSRTTEGVACVAESYCCDAQNRHDTKAWEWAQHPLPAPVVLDVLPWDWEDLEQERLLRR